MRTNRKENLRPLEKRVYKYKNKNRNFFCPLCRTERNVTVSPRLSRKNYFQIFISSVVFGSMLFPLMGAESYFIFFVIWGGFELAVRSDYKKQIPCPHCGFDATTYKRNVKIAREEVVDFWARKNVSPATDNDAAARQS